jgi:hypothetical protein
MNAPIVTPLVHYFDTRQHRILCGLRGFEHRSTKHARNVTCEACVALLGKPLEGDAPSRASAPDDRVVP